MKKTIKIEGMHCPKCEAKVKTAMEALENVNSAEVSHEADTAVLDLSADISEDLVRKTVEDCGFQYISME